jgi:hypothetical protein
MNLGVDTPPLLFGDYFMKYLLNFVLALLLFGALGSHESKAYSRPFFHGYVFNGIYQGWGFYPIVSGFWPWAYYNYPAWQPYGYSYLSYWNYQPYYASFGAISYSPKNEYVGVSWGKATGQEAMSEANRYCDKSDCAPVVWVQGGCAAVAKGTGVESLFWAYSTTRLAAETDAMRACNKNSGDSNCKLGGWTCSW